MKSIIAGVLSISMIAASTAYALTFNKLTDSGRGYETVEVNVTNTTNNGFYIQNHQIVVMAQNYISPHQTKPIQLIITCSPTSPTNVTNNVALDYLLTRETTDVPIDCRTSFNYDYRLAKNPGTTTPTTTEGKDFKVTATALGTRDQEWPDVVDLSIENA